MAAEREMNWWKFWTWHFHRCQTMSDDSGCWGECVKCGKRFGFVSRADLRACADREYDAWNHRYQRRMKELCGDDFTMQAGFQRGWLAAMQYQHDAEATERDL
jgi:hypothetical protein